MVAVNINDKNDQDDEFERAAGQLEGPLATVVGDYEERDAVDATTPRARGIFLLPNLFTTGALFAGFYSIVAGMQGDFYSGSVAIFVALVLDGLDGRIARLTNTMSAFGAEYDSLSDMVSFGVAPALLMFNWALTDIGKVGWVAAFIYTACAALRLARFNTQHGSADNRYFSGLASPAAAALVAGSVWLGQDYGVSRQALPWPVIHSALLVLVGFLMIANFPYYSFKQINLAGRVPFVRMLLALLLLGLIALNPPVMLWGLFLLYALSGPLQLLRRSVFKDLSHKGADDESPSI
ncbi:CDP-diacylglycerol--serine O-phosphatidyltransferase [bacterium]|nr:CDP-diacylglycerol--serine O-phosphatidyltransferase [bacterium]